MKLYQFLAQQIVRLKHLEWAPSPEPGTYKTRVEMARNLRSRITDFVKENFPSGSGFDAGTQFDIDKATDAKLEFKTAFHHMDENGFYDGWTEHTVIVTASMGFGFNLRVTGRDRKQIKSYIADTFHQTLNLDAYWTFPD